MIFLKKFKASGFKSFANDIEINFNHSTIGVVGPNGSGKSNIVDAIKWVLGEKSHKNLRSKVGEDIIFHGSKGHDQSEFAEVSLYFDNQSRKIKIDQNEVVVCRRLYRGSGNNEYFINHQPCRLKDISEMFLDTGLSKGSLGIISQGTVQWFVEAKPQDRRRIFEDAAGIGLYAKKKEESNSQLAHTSENLNRINDIANELEKDLKKIQKQAEKAKIYSEKYSQLKQLDLTILVKDLSFFKQQLNQTLLQSQTNNSDLEVLEPQLKQIQAQLVFSKTQLDTADVNLEEFNLKLTDLVEEINKLEIKKQSFKNQVLTDLSSENIAKKLKAYQDLMASISFEIQDRKQKFDKVNDEILGYTEIATDLTHKRDNLLENSNNLTIKSSELKTQIKFINESANTRNYLDIGVKTIIDNKTAITGICGIVKEFINTDQQYEKAIVTALNKSLQSIIVNDETDAQTAINFLKHNQAGKATFLPITSIRPRFINPEHLTVLKTLPGFINIGSKLITFDVKYTNVMESLLGNTIIADEIENAIKLSKYTYQLYRVITLDGDVVNAGGSITGGYLRVNPATSFNYDKKLHELSEENETIVTQLFDDKLKLNKIISELDQINSKLNEKKMLSSRYEEFIKTSEGQLYSYQTEYDQISHQGNLKDKNIKWTPAKADQELNTLNAKKDKLNEEININRQTKILHKSQVEDYEAKLEEIRNQIANLKAHDTKLKTDQIKCENIIENAKNKINQFYKMTLEFAIENYTKELPVSETQARELIAQLQNDLDRLGPVNMEAIAELGEKQARFDELKQQQAELESARDNITKAINELDLKAKADFTNTISQVNKALPEIFKYLFGGGSCVVEYTDPSDVLTSGIEVLANPPGKNIVNLNLLSGGEKTLVALSILFAILKNRAFPLVILDEAESALDPANVERFGNIIKANDEQTQFIVITHRPGTMERCDALFGATMQIKGVTSVFSVSINQASEINEE